MSKKRFLISAIFSLFITTCYLNSAIAEDYYVSTHGSDSPFRGLTSETAWKTITHALTQIAANSFDTAIIHVAPGTYSPSTTGESYPLIMKSWISLQGAGADSTILDTESIPDKRAILCENVSNFKIDGFQITGGSGAGSFPENVGGIIRCVSSSPIISNNKIVNNDAGGIWCHYSSPTIISNIISDNSVFDSGAGIKCTYSSPMIANNRITDNSAAGSGGGIFCYKSSTTITCNTITENNCQSFFYKGGGGGIACFESSPLITMNIITNNEAIMTDSAEGGGIFCSEDSNPLIGGSYGNGNDIFENQGSDKGRNIFRLGLGTIVNAQCNYFGGSEPTEVSVYPISQFDVSNYRTLPISGNRVPILTVIFPPGDTTITVIDRLTFSVLAIDPDGDSLSYIWTKNDIKVSSYPNYTLIPTTTDIGIDTIIVAISDSEATVIHKWFITILPVVHPISGLAKSLTIGNKFFFEKILKPELGEPVTLKITETVIGETNIHGKIYAIVENVSNGSIFRRYERSDSTRLYQYNSVADSDFVVYDLNWCVGDTVFINYAYLMFIPGSDSILIEGYNIYMVTENYISDEYGINGYKVKIEQPSNYGYHEEITYYQTLGLSYYLSYSGYISMGYIKKFLEGAVIEGHTYYTGIENMNTGDNDYPKYFKLSQNYPNPFNAETVIRYQLTKSSLVTLRIFNTLGQEIRRLVDEEKTAGCYTTRWNGNNAAGIAMASGIYLVRMESGGFTETKKLLLIW